MADPALHLEIWKTLPCGTSVTRVHKQVCAAPEHQPRHVISRIVCKLGTAWHSMTCQASRAVPTDALLAHHVGHELQGLTAERWQCAGGGQECQAETLGPTAPTARFAAHRRLDHSTCLPGGVCEQPYD